MGAMCFFCLWGYISVMSVYHFPEGGLWNVAWYGVPWVPVDVVWEDEDDDEEEDE